MAKLHELLAVETDQRGQAEACRKDLKYTFENKGHLFTKKLVTLKFREDGVDDRTEEQLSLQTTVGDELKWITEKLRPSVDIGHQVDVGNTLAKADVVLDNGEMLLKDVPTTSLLRLAHRLDEIRELVHSIKTLDPSQGFDLDPNDRKGVYKARDKHSTRGEKKFDYVVMVQPTERHPAQVKELMVDKVTVDVVTQEWSGLITVKQKADMLDRVEDVIRAVKKARARANEMDLDVRQYVIGTKVLNFVFGPEAA